MYFPLYFAGLTQFTFPLSSLPHCEDMRSRAAPVKTTTNLFITSVITELLISCRERQRHSGAATRHSLHRHRCRGRIRTQRLARVRLKRTFLLSRVEQDAMQAFAGCGTNSVQNQRLLIIAPSITNVAFIVCFTTVQNV